MRLTVVGHDASRTGAPIALMSALRWATAHTSVDARLLLLDDGPLRATYGSLVPTEVLASRARSLSGRTIAGVRSVGLPVPEVDPVLHALLRRVDVGDVVLANTLASLPAAAVLAHGGARPRVVCHVHELDGVAERVLPPTRGTRSRLMAQVDTFIAAGDPVRSMLVDRMGIDPRLVVVVDGWVDTPPDVDPAAGRRMLGVGQDRPLLLAVGAMHRRKGPERFADLMALVGEHHKRPIGRWLGGAPGSAVWHEVASQIRRPNDSASLQPVASIADPLPCVAAADVVVSTSIEDPFPLSVLEAASLGVPVVGYDSGGLGQILAAAGQPQAGVPVGDLLGLAALIERLLDDPEERRCRGGALQDWLFEGHLAEHQVPRWWQAVSG